MALKFKPKTGPFSSESHDQTMIKKLINEEKIIEHRIQQRRSEIANKILARYDLGMSIPTLGTIYGKDIVHEVLNTELKRKGLSSIDNTIRSSAITNPEISASRARVMERMAHKRVGARA